MGSGFHFYTSWEDVFLTVAVAVFVALSGAGLFLAWRSRRRD